MIKQTIGQKTALSLFQLLRGWCDEETRTPIQRVFVNKAGLKRASVCWSSTFDDERFEDFRPHVGNGPEGDKLRQRDAIRFSPLFHFSRHWAARPLLSPEKINKKQAPFIQTGDLVNCFCDLRDLVRKWFKMLKHVITRTIWHAHKSYAGSEWFESKTGLSVCREGKVF